MLFTSFYPLTCLLPFIVAIDLTIEETFKPPPKLLPQPLNITTLAGNADRESVLECWSVAELALSETPGIKGALVAGLGQPNALNFFNIPAEYDGGLHNAPMVQWVYFTSGEAVLGSPTSSYKATIKGGANGLILAADVAAFSKLGHTTVYPSKDRTVGVVIPIADNKVPAHKVLHQEACTDKELDVSK